MQITIHGETKYIPVSTVTIQKEGEGITHPFHCINCGNTMNIIGGKVIRIVPFLEPSDQLPVINTCKSCKAKVVFQESDPILSTYIKVVLKPGTQRQSFFCYLGGGELKDMNRIIEYQEGNIFSFFDGKDVSIPFVSRCTNLDCTLQYEFTQYN